mgnify:CR=1 FL=1
MTLLETLSQGLSFAFVAIVAVTSVRGALTSLRRAFISSASSATGASQLSLMLAALLGCYFIASLLLLRNALPERYRGIVTEALGDAHAFPLYYLWFDLVFLGSAALAAVAVGAHVLSNEAHGHGGGADGGGESFGSGGGIGGYGGGAGARALGASVGLGARCASMPESNGHGARLACTACPPLALSRKDR